MVYTNSTAKFVRLLSGVLVTLTLLISMTLPTYAAGDTYNCGAYSEGPYQGSVCGATTTDNLTNTGEKLLPFIVPALLILAGTLLMYRSRRKMKARTSGPPRV